MKVNNKKFNKGLDKWLFEVSEDQLAGNLADEKEDILPDSHPIIPMNQMAIQLSQEKPPIEDPEWEPATPKDLSAAAAQLASTVPYDQLEFFYLELQKLRDAAITRSNEPDINDTVFEPGGIQNQVNVKSEAVLKKQLLKKRAVSFLRGYIIDVTKNNKGVPLNEDKEDKKGKKWQARKGGSPRNRRWKRSDDFAYKWKQGDPLDFERGDDIGSTYDGYRSQDDYDIADTGDEFVPDVDDIRDMMDAYDEDDPTKIAGYRPEMAKEFGLADIVKSNIYPTVKGESGITNKLEREIYPVLRAVKNAPQLVDRLTSLIKSKFGQTTFFESMLSAGLIDKENIGQLKKEESFTSSEMYKYVTHQTIIVPAMKELAKLKRAGVYDPLGKKSQLSPDEADVIIEKIRKRWNGMTKARKANDAKKGMQANLEFLERDTSVMG